MEEREQKKLTKMLTKWGVAPDEMDEFLKEYYASLKEDDPKEESGAEAGNESDPNAKANAEKEEPKEEKSVSADEKGNEDKAEPSEKKEEAANEPNGSEEQKAPAEEEADKKEAPTPEDESKENEYKKAIDGLNAKFDGLVDALTKAGLLTQEKQQVGVDGENLQANDVGKGTQSALDAINKGRKY